MDIQITQTTNTIKFLRIADVGGIIEEVRFNAAATSIAVTDTTFKLITADRYIEEFEWADVSVPVNTGVQSLLGTLNSYIPAGGGGTGTIGGTVADTEIAFGTALDTIGSTPELIWNDTMKELGITGTILLTHTATEADDHGLEIIANASGFGDVKALDIDYISGAIGVGDEEEAILINVDETLSTGGEISGFAIVSTNEGSAQTIAVSVGATIDPIVQQSGSFVNMDQADVDGVDELADLINPAVTTNIFVNDNDTLVIGDAAVFQEMEVLLDTGASGSGITPVFEFSTGVGTWGSFSPIDGTNAFKNTGVIEWSTADVPAWATGTGGNFLIRITRTKNSLSTIPIADLIQIAATTEYMWDADAKVTISELGLDGGSGNFRGRGTTATRDALTPAAADGDGWFNIERHVFEDFDGDVWLNPQLIKVRNQTGGLALQGQSVEFDQTEAPGGEPDVIYSPDVSDEILGVVVDGDLASGGLMTVAVTGTYLIYSTEAIVIGSFIRPTGSGDNGDEAFPEVSNYARSLTSKAIGAGTFTGLLLGPEIF